jgi:MFS family permease
MTNFDQPRKAYAIFALFAFAYLMSTALRSINAVLAPELIREFHLSASALGLLSAVYFLGFTAAQWPLGPWLDKHGPRKVESALLCIAMLGVALFAFAHNLTWLTIGRLLFGVGVSACLMAPYTGYRSWFSGAVNARFSSWMLTVGSTGMIVSTLPVQWALPLIGWRAVFGVAFVLLFAAVALLWFFSPRTASGASSDNASVKAGYRDVFAHPEFKALAPFLLCTYGTVLAIQTLWIGPWYTQVAGYTQAQAAWGVLGVHAAMGTMFLIWGAVLPKLLQRGLTAQRLTARLMPIGLMLIGLAIMFSPIYPSFAAVLWALAFAGTSVISVSQITIARYFPLSLAGRANTATNLMIFSGAFVMQWAIGGLMDGFASLGLGQAQRFQAAFGIGLLLMCLSWAWYCFAPRIALIPVIEPAS